MILFLICGEGVIDFEARADPKADGVSWRKRERRGGKEREREG